MKINFKVRRVNKPRILSEGTPQNECTPMAGTFASTIRKTSSFLNDWNTAPIDKIFFGFLITITLISSSNSLIGTCFMFPDEQRRRQRKQEERHFMSKSISNFPPGPSQIGKSSLPRSHVAEYRPPESKSHVHSIGHFLMLLVCGRTIRAKSSTLVVNSLIIVPVIEASERNGMKPQ